MDKKIVPHWANAYGPGEEKAAGHKRPANIPSWANAWNVPEEDQGGSPEDSEAPRNKGGRPAKNRPE